MTMSDEQTLSGRPAEPPGCSASELVGIGAIVDCAHEAARLLKLLANEKRLVILCFLATRGEMPVGALVEALGLSQSALSQHLAKLRRDGLVLFRRESQTLHYRLADPRVMRVLGVLQEIFCTRSPRVLGRLDRNDRCRRVSPVAVRSGEGPLTERTAGAQPARRERVFMPHCRPSSRSEDRSGRLVSGHSIEASGSQAAAAGNRPSCSFNSSKSIGWLK